MKTLRNAYICCILLCIVLLFYKNSGTKKNESNLPNLSAENVKYRTQNNIDRSNAHHDETQLRKKHTQNTNTNDEAVQREQAQQVIQKALSFDFTNQPEIYPTLEAALKTVYNDDARIPRFLSLWNELNNILQKMKNYQANGGDLETLLELSPNVILNDFVELSSDLLKLSEAETTEVLLSAAKWEETVFALEIANNMLPFIQNAVNTGKMTVDEAKTFLKNVSGLQVDIKFIEIQK